MIPTAIDFGIQSHSGTMIESLNAEETVEVAETMGSDGEVARATPYKKMIKGSVKGHGEITMAAGVGDAEVDGIAGGVTIITSFKVEESNQADNGWEYSFTNYPHAVAAA